MRSPEGEYETVDFRESAPAAAHQHMYDHLGDWASIWGGLAPGVPGELRGMEYLHERFGRLPWYDLVMPSVHLARDGYRVNEDLMRYIGVWNSSFLTDDPSWAIDFAPHGRLVELGEKMSRKRYADTLEIIAEEGAQVFYQGRIAESMVRAVQERDGIMTLTDVEEYQAIIRNVSQTTYRGYKLTSTTAPSSGTVALSILKTMETYHDITTSENRNLTLHRLIEAMKWAYATVRANISTALCAFILLIDIAEDPSRGPRVCIELIRYRKSIIGREPYQMASWYDQRRQDISNRVL